MRDTLSGRTAVVACALASAIVFGNPVPMSAAGGDARLVDAAKARDAAGVRKLLAGRANVNATHPDGATALLWAAQWDEVEISKALLQAGANVNLANDYGVSPLSMAATNGSAPMTALLLGAGANPNAALPTGETVLMTAAHTGRVAVVEALLARGAAVNAVESVRGQTPLMWALAEKHVDVARTLLDRGADISAASKSGFTALMFAAREGDLEAVALLVSRGARVNDTAADGVTPLLVATVRGHVDVATQLLERGADPNVQAAGYTPLHWASGVWESVTTHDYFQVEAGEWSVMAGVPSRAAKLSLIKALLSHGADPNARVKKAPPRFGWNLFKNKYVMGATPFYLAALSADTGIMRLLMANGANPVTKADDDTTALIVAAGMARVDTEGRIPEAQYLDAVKLILGMGGTDILAANDMGNTALHAAAMAGFNSVAQFLADSGARLNAKNRDGATPLKLAEGYVLDTMIYIRPGTAELLRRLGGTVE